MVTHCKMLINSSTDCNNMKSVNCNIQNSLRDSHDTEWSCTVLQDVWKLRVLARKRWQIQKVTLKTIGWKYYLQRLGQDERSPTSSQGSAPTGSYHYPLPAESKEAAIGTQEGCSCGKKLLMRRSHCQALPSSQWARRVSTSRSFPAPACASHWPNPGGIQRVLTALYAAIETSLLGQDQGKGCRVYRRDQWKMPSSTANQLFSSCFCSVMSNLFFRRTGLSLSLFQLSLKEHVVLCVFFVLLISKTRNS